MILTEECVKNDSVLYYVLYMMKFTLLWPIDRGSLMKNVLTKIFFCGLCFSLGLSSVALFAKVIKTTDLVDRSEAVDIFTLTACALFKLIFFTTYHDEVRGLVSKIDDDFPMSPYIGEDEFDMDEEMKWCGPLTGFHCSMGLMVSTFWCFCPILKYLLEMTSFQEMSLPLNVWYPFDYKQGQVYYVLYAIHYYAFAVGAHIHLVCDGFLFSIIYFIIVQIKVLKLSLKGIDKIVKEDYESTEVAKINALKKCIQHHSNILSLLRELDLMMRTILGTDVMHAIFSLSFSMFTTSEAKGVLEQIKMVTFLSYCIFHQFLQSTFGQLLINEQESLLNEVYEINWDERSVPFRRLISITMGGGCRIVIKLSAWTVYFLQSETFVEFMRSMVSFFMVLRTLQEKGIIQD